MYVIIFFIIVKNIKIYIIVFKKVKSDIFDLN
jgi:hypothetical protein